MRARRYEPNEPRTRPLIPCTARGTGGCESGVTATGGVGDENLYKSYLRRLAQTAAVVLFDEARGLLAFDFPFLISEPNALTGPAAGAAPRLPLPRIASDVR